MGTVVQGVDNQIDSERRADRKAWALILAVVLFTLLPYLFGAWLSLGRKYFWINHNIDDNCVYLAWIRQAWEGHFLFENRFTTDPQPRLSTNLFFWAIGTIARWTGLPVLFLFHAARMALGIVWLWTLWLLYKRLLPNGARMPALWLACVSAGLGWLFWRDAGIDAPIDTWQVEAFTFLSLYLNPLFVVGTLLMTACIYNLWRAVQERRWVYTVRAGIWALLVGNIHSYDVIQVAGAWLAFLVVSSFVQRRFDRQRWLMGLTAGAIGLPTVAYQYWLYRVDPIFRHRADVPTSAPPLWHVLAGYAPLLILAVAAVWVTVRERRHREEPFLLLFCWAVVGIGLQYLPRIFSAAGIHLPMNFERKMVMGAHLPLCALAGWGLWLLVRHLPARRALLVTALVIALTTPSNVRWLIRDAHNLIRNMANTGMHRAYMEPEEWEAIQWLARNTNPEEAVLTFPSFGVFVPPFAGNRVYVGHWGETPQFAERLRETLRFLDARRSDEERYELLRRARVKYIVAFTPELQGWFGVPLRDFVAQPLRGTEVVFQNRLIVILKVL
jgi:arabinosyltransferase C